MQKSTSAARFVGVVQTLLKPMKTNTIDHLETSQNTKILKINKDYNQIWIARFRLIWLVPERSRSTIRLRYSNIIKTNENQPIWTFRDI